VKSLSDLAKLACLLVSGLETGDVRKLRGEQLVIVKYRGLISSIRFSLDELDALDDEMVLGMLVARLRTFKADVDHALPKRQ
jgi:hypothetical protein